MMELVRCRNIQQHAEKCSPARLSVNPAASCIVKTCLWEFTTMAACSKPVRRAGKLFAKTPPAKVSNSCDKVRSGLARA